MIKAWFTNANTNAKENNVHRSNSNTRKARYAATVKDSQTFSKMAGASEALAAVSLLFMAFVYRVLKG